MTVPRRMRKKLAAARLLNAALPKPACPNCGQEGKHFIPPSLGEPGFYACAPKEPTNDD